MMIYRCGVPEGRGSTPPNENNVCRAGFNGQSRALPLQTTIILYDHTIHVAYR